VSRTILVFGPAQVGKSALITTYAHGIYPPQSDPYCPTMYDEVFHETWSGGERVNLRIIDTGGADDFIMLRQLACREAHVLMLCFSITDPSTLHQLPRLWDEAKKQITSKTTSPPISPSSHQQPQDPNSTSVPTRLVDRSEAEQMASILGASKYMECSALADRGVREVFDTALK
ncbi:P-loop containing nucleoside triphosphate hydrolase protein, partial [Piptocephalis cylindrospora]